MRFRVSNIAVFVETKTILKQALWFCVAGVLGFLVEVSILQIGISMSAGPIWPRVFSLPTAIWVTYVVNKNFSFKMEAKRDNHYFFSYFIGMLLGAALNLGIYTLAVISGITPALSLAIAVAISAICNFVTSRFIFSRVAD